MPGRRGAGHVGLGHDVELEERFCQEVGAKRAQEPRGRKGGEAGVEPEEIDRAWTSVEGW